MPVHLHRARHHRMDLYFHVKTKNSSMLSVRQPYYHEESSVQTLS